MKKVLILFAHPNFERSRTNKALVQKITDKEGVTFHDLYESYPDFNIDVPFERKLLRKHNVVVWHHPLYWYSCPPLMKQWIDTVLEFDWAYGPEGNTLKSKKCLSVITSAGSREVYCSEGANSYSVPEFLRPFEQTAKLCGMDYLPPFTVMGTHKLSDAELAGHADQYGQLIKLLQEDRSAGAMEHCALLNDLHELNNPDLI